MRKVISRVLVIIGLLTLIGSLLYSADLVSTYQDSTAAGDFAGFSLSFFFLVAFLAPTAIAFLAGGLLIESSPIESSPRLNLLRRNPAKKILAIFFFIVSMISFLLFMLLLSWALGSIFSSDLTSFDVGDMLAIFFRNFLFGLPLLATASILFIASLRLTTSS